MQGIWELSVISSQTFCKTVPKAKTDLKSANAFHHLMRINEKKHNLIMYT